MTRREALEWLLGSALALPACGGRAAGPAAAPRGAETKIEPLVDLAPAAGLSWLVDARPRELLASPVLAPAVAVVVPAARFDRFAERNGGVDLRRIERLVVAGYPEATLLLARVDFEPGRVEGAFAARAIAVEGRAIEAAGAITRFWGSVGARREQVALFDHRAIGMEHGRFGPLRASEYFAQGKLHRALPALRAEPLATAERLAGDAPLRAFAPGPFDREWAAGLGGLLRATTAVAGTLVPLEPRAAGPAVAAGFVLTGAWGADAPAAAERLLAAFRLLADDPLGGLLGIDHPLEEPRVSGDAQALRLQVVLDPVVLARGLHAATDATIQEIMAS